MMPVTAILAACCIILALPGLLVGQSDKTPGDTVSARSSYIQGLTAFENENYEQAVEYLTKAYPQLSDRAGVNFALADAYFHLNDLANAVHYGKKAAEMDPENKWYQLKLANIYQQYGKNQATIDALRTALKYHPDAVEVYRKLAQVYSQHGEYLKSNEIYNRLLRKTGSDIGIQLQKLRNFYELNMRDSSIAVLERIRQLDPDNLSTLHMLSNFYQKVDKPDQAKDVLRKAVEKNPRDPKSLVMLADVYINEAQWDSVSILMGSVMADSLVEPQAKLEVARHLYTQYSNSSGNTGLKEAASKVIDRFVQHEPGFDGAHALAADFYLSVNNNEKALESLAKTNELRPGNEQAWLQRLQLLLTEGRYEEVINLSGRAEEHVPQNAFVQYFIGSAHLQENNNREAASYFEEATRLPSRRQNKSIFFGSLGDAYSAMEAWDKAYKAYEEALKLDPNNSTVLNNYAYYLSLQGEQLDRAEKMGLKALGMANNANTRASYLDTVGWIYFKKGNYEKARKYVQKSIGTGESSAEVLEHMGDIMEKLGRMNEARRWWEKAFEQDSTRTHLKEKITQ